MTPKGDLAVLLRAMADAQLDLSVDGLRDALWLALQPGLHLDFPGMQPDPKIEVPPPMPLDPGEGTPSTPSPPTAAGPAGPKLRESAPKVPEPVQDKDRKDVFPSPAEAGEAHTLPASPLRIPAGLALAGKLPLTRSLRPLRRWFRNSSVCQLNEEETVEETARAGGILMPVLQPRLERWYEMMLVADSGSSMDVWQETLSEFEEVARTAGVFRDVRRRRLAWKVEEEKQPEERALLINADGVVSRAVSLAQTNVRRMIIIATNGVSPSWTNGDMAALLAVWSRMCAVAILHMLPESLWHRGRLGEPHLLLRAMAPGTVTKSLEAGALWDEDDLVDANGERITSVKGAVPLFPLDPAWVGKWAKMQTGAGQWVPGIVVGRTEGRAAAVASEAVNVDWTRAVNAFYRSCTPEARSLAVYLSQGAFTLPVARLVQSVKFGANASQTQLAEVLLSGLVERTTAADAGLPHDWVEYRFHPDASQLLERGLRDSDKEEIADALAKHIERYWGKPIEFQALVYDPDGLARIPEWAQPFARLARLLFEIPEDPEPPDDGRPTLFVLCVSDSLRGLTWQIGAGLAQKGIRVLMSGRHRVPGKGVALVIGEEVPLRGLVNEDHARIIEQGIAGIFLHGPGVKPWGQSYLFYDSYSSREELLDGIVAEMGKLSQAAAPPVVGAPPLDHGHWWAGEKSLAVAVDAIGRYNLILYSNEAFDARSVVRDVVWSRDIRLKFPSGIHWIRPGGSFEAKSDRLLVFEKPEEAGPALMMNPFVMLDPDFPATALNWALARVIEGDKDAVNVVVEKWRASLIARGAFGPEMFDLFPHSPHVCELLDRISRSRVWNSIGPVVNQTVASMQKEDSQGPATVSSFERRFRRTVFASLDSGLRDAAGTLAALGDAAPGELRKGLADPETASTLEWLDLVSIKNSTPHATGTCKFLAAENPSWAEWNLQGLSLLGVSVPDNWLGPATDSSYVRANLIGFLREGNRLDLVNIVLSDFQWWQLRIDKGESAAFEKELKGWSVIGGFLAATPDFESLTAPAAAFRLAGFRGPIPSQLLESANIFLQQTAPPRQRRFILVAGSRTRDSQSKLREEIAWMAAAIGRELSRRGYGLVCGAELGCDTAAIAAFVKESQLYGRNPYRDLRIVTYEDLPRELPLSPEVKVTYTDDQVTASIQMADAVILLGGNQWVRRIFNAAIAAGKPVFPVRGTGEAAAELFSQQVKEKTLRQKLGSTISIRDEQTSRSIAFDLIDGVEQELAASNANRAYSARLLEEWNQYLDPSRDTDPLFDWRAGTPKLSDAALLDLIRSHDAAERIIGFTSFWINRSLDIVAEVASVLIECVTVANAQTEIYVLLGVCNIMLLEPPLFPGEHFVRALQPLLLRFSPGMVSKRALEVTDRVKKLSRQVESWSLANRILTAPDLRQRAFDLAALRRVKPVYGLREIENHLRRRPGGAYRLYAYAYLAQQPDASRLDWLIECLVDGEDQPHVRDVGLEALQGMVRGRPLSESQWQRLRIIDQWLPVSLRPPTEFLPLLELTGPRDVAYVDDPDERHGSFVVTRGAHYLKLPPKFRIGIYPVTNILFLQFIRERGYVRDEYWPRISRHRFLTRDGKSNGPATWPSGTEFPQGNDNHPVTGISYLEARAFVAWLEKVHRAPGSRWCLPSEDMWEFAARSQEGNIYPWGKEFQRDRCNSAESGIGGTSDVARFPNGKSFCGCAEMAGNVWEFVERADPGSSFCVLRGGGFTNHQDEVRSYFRLVNVPTGHRAHDFGFRCAQAPVTSGSGAPKPASKRNPVKNGSEKEMK